MYCLRLRYSLRTCSSHVVLFKGFEFVLINLLSVSLFWSKFLLTPPYFLSIFFIWHYRSHSEYTVVPVQSLLVSWTACIIIIYAIHFHLFSVPFYTHTSMYISLNYCTRHLFDAFNHFIHGLLWKRFNSLRPGDASINVHQWTGSAFVQVMACRLFGAKPLPEPMLTYCQLDPQE